MMPLYKIVYEIIEDLDKIFTPDQKQAIEKEVNELYKQNILKDTEIKLVQAIMNKKPLMMAVFYYIVVSGRNPR